MYCKKIIEKIDELNFSKYSMAIVDRQSYYQQMAKSLIANCCVWDRFYEKKKYYEKKGTMSWEKSTSDAHSRNYTRPVCTSARAEHFQRMHSIVFGESLLLLISSTDYCGAKFILCERKNLIFVQNTSVIYFLRFKWNRNKQ